MLLDLVVKRRLVVALVALVGLAVPAGFTFNLATQLSSINHHGFFNMLIVDEYAIFFKLLFILIGAVMILVSYDYVSKYVRSSGEFYALLLFSVTGMMLMASSSELITIYISLELTSIPLYIMAGLLRNNDRSAEAAVKYVLLGAMSSAILLYGFALLYGITGTTDLSGIAQATVKGVSQGNILLLMADIFVLAGFGFKVSAVPFHTWAPDIYEGAPTPATGFFSVGSKAAGFAALIRVFIDGNLGPSNGQTMIVLLSVIAILTMTLGNVVAIVQSNVKRMMAYSSIGQAGYILVGFAASVDGHSSAGTSSVLFFLFVYVLTNLGTFAGIVALSHALGTDNVRDFEGLRSRNAWLAVGTSICLLSLAGVPPMAGFIAKFVLFAAAWQQGLEWLVVIGVINSLISMGYYGYLVYIMFVKPPQKEGHISSSLSLNTALAISAVGIIVVTILTQFFLAQSQIGANSLISFLGH